MDNTGYTANPSSSPRRSLPRNALVRGPGSSTAVGKPLDSGLRRNDGTPSPRRRPGSSTGAEKPLDSGLRRNDEATPLDSGPRRNDETGALCSNLWNYRSNIENTMESVAAVLFGKTRQAVLGLLFADPETSLYLREMSRLTGIAPGPLQHELAQLLKADLVVREQDGNRVAYRANAAHPVFADLQGLVAKTCGIPALLAAALAPLAGRIAFAAIYGSLAKGANHARSDVDLLIVGDIALKKALSAIAPVEARIGREVSVRIFSREEFRQRRARRDAFIAGVLSGPLTPLMGALDDA